ncbi:type IV pilus minor pilin PilX [Geomonas limicola]|uniref:Type IV pilus minor pilin PilX n=1 Tax=Geomonas limicola TaxID=2740186 RepID=A0A6V8N4F4_9BACT|nr:pilus assembly protein PilX [Geomonas limicola]GFO66844.1 type IV pilus minor pilin PilX [Geomonas limicola]
MKQLQNQKGVALVVSLMFALICLAMILALLYFVLATTKNTGAQTRYRSSLEASYGGTDLLTKTVIPRLFSNYSTGYLSLMQDFGGSNTLNMTIGSKSVLKEKMFTDTADWSGLAMKTTNPKQSPDITFTLPGQNGSPGYKVYTKIVDTTKGVGLVDASGIDYLDSGIGVAGAGSATQTMRTPNIYTIEVQGEKATNPKEKASLSVVYAY